MGRRKRTLYARDVGPQAPRTCPSCHEVLNGAAQVSPDCPPPMRLTQMKPGDVSVCVYCSAVLVVTPNGFTLATETDLARLEPTMRRLLRGKLARG